MEGRKGCDPELVICWLAKLGAADDEKRRENPSSSRKVAER